MSIHHLIGKIRSADRQSKDAKEFSEKLINLCYEDGVLVSFLSRRYGVLNDLFSPTVMNVTPADFMPNEECNYAVLVDFILNVAQLNSRKREALFSSLKSEFKVDPAAFQVPVIDAGPALRTHFPTQTNILQTHTYIMKRVQSAYQLLAADGPKSDELKEEMYAAMDYVMFALRMENTALFQHSFGTWLTAGEQTTLPSGYSFLTLALASENAPWISYLLERRLVSEKCTVGELQAHLYACTHYLENALFAAPATETSIKAMGFSELMCQALKVILKNPNLVFNTSFDYLSNHFPGIGHYLENSFAIRMFQMFSTLLKNPRYVAKTGLMDEMLGVIKAIFEHPNWSFQIPPFTNAVDAAHGTSWLQRLHMIVAQLQYYPEVTDAEAKIRTERHKTFFGAWVKLLQDALRKEVSKQLSSTDLLSALDAGINSQRSGDKHLPKELLLIICRQNLNALRLRIYPLFNKSYARFTTEDEIQKQLDTEDEIQKQLDVEAEQLALVAGSAEKPVNSELLGLILIDDAIEHYLLNSELSPVLTETERKESKEQAEQDAIGEALQQRSELLLSFCPSVLSAQAAAAAPDRSAAAPVSRQYKG
ncbi:MAG: hypothetical protein ACKOAD_08270 [Gammaproteobacteria bacterium]